jgi:hypothetical protein
MYPDSVNSFKDTEAMIQVCLTLFFQSLLSSDLRVSFTIGHVHFTP